MLKAGLLEEVPAPGDDTTVVLRITEAGLVAIGEPSTAEPVGEGGVPAQEGGEGQQSGGAAPDVHEPHDTPTPPPRPRTSLQQAATALLVAWDAGGSALPVAI